MRVDSHGVVASLEFLQVQPAKRPAQGRPGRTSRSQKLTEWYAAGSGLAHFQGEPMVVKFSRRTVLNLPVGAAVLSLGARSSSSGACESGSGPDGCGLPTPAEAPFDTVVVLMMENRSFDHVLGWLPGANGRQKGLTYPDKHGIAQATWPLAPDFQCCRYLDPDHTWEGIRDQYADGQCDGFLRTPSAKVGDLFPIGYYREDDLPILSYRRCSAPRAVRLAHAREG